MHVVWFKRDLRIHDHRALTYAARQGDVLPLYVVEPDLWQQPDSAPRHWDFIAECLAELRADLAHLGQPLVVRVGEITSALDQLTNTQPITALWSHEETGNGWTYARDRRTAAWCKARGIPWHELQNHGVIRRMAARDGWADRWDRLMAEPLTPPPAALRPLPIPAGPIPTAAQLRLGPDPCPRRQTGGRRAGRERLSSFLEHRGQTYRSAMSSPIAGETACSRLSPHLAWGSLSIREVAQATWARQRALKSNPPKGKSPWRGAMTSFNGRLHWHCHFIQKLEDAPRLEHENLHRSYDGLRPSAPDTTRLTAWANGETGLPFVDACMRYLCATGWLNFRMRAMVMSTASYHLWLDWRAPGAQLARLFTDYEPGIHWSQVQMQSGTTGINTVRIYNPVKQGYDQDPTGTFIRRWVPELAAIPDRFVHEPWKAENAGQVLGRRYPEPIVNHLAAARHAREQIWAVRNGQRFRDEAAAIVSKHASRRKPHQRRPRKPAPVAQLSLPFGDDL